jgi:iron complex outermembrane recepter protein
MAVGHASSQRQGAGISLRGGHLIKLLLASTILAATPAAAQQASTAPASAEAIAFRIPAQSLSSAINAFIRATGWQISYSSALVRGKTSKAVSGTMPAARALRQLVAGTGISVKTGAPGSAALVGATDVEGNAAADGLIQLETIVVDGQGDTGTRGFVATRSTAGTKTQTPLTETPQSISVVTRDQLTARNAQTVTEAVKYSAGVSTEPGGSDQRYDQVFIRGFNEYLYGDYRDGLRQPGRSYSYFRTEPYGLERIDILRGPTSVLYGQNAPGGLIDRISKLPSADHVNEVMLQGGTQGRIQGAFDLGGAIPDNPDLLYRIVGVARSGDNLQSSDLPDDRLYLAPSLTWKPTEDTTLTIRAEALRDVSGYNFYYTAPGTTPTHITTGEPSFDRFEQEQYSIGYQFEHKFTEDLIFRQKLRYGDLGVDYHSVYGLGAVRPGTTLLPRYASRVEEDLNALVVDNQGQVNFDLGSTRHEVLVGLDYQRWTSIADTRMGLAPDLDISNPVYDIPIAEPALYTSRQRQVQKQLGIYAQDQVKFDNWVLTLGGRMDWADSDTRNRLTGATTEMEDSAFTWRAGLTYLFDNGLAPYFSYSTSFLPETGTTSPARGSTPFDPTTGQQYEIGVKYEPLGWNGFVTLSLFDLTRQNVTTTDPDDIRYKVQTGEVRSRGIELEATTSLDEGLSLTAAFTYQDVEVTKSNAADLGKRPTQVPEYMASLWVDYTVQNGPLDGLGLGAGVRYVGSTYGDPTNAIKNPGYTLVDAAIRYDLGKLNPEMDGWKAAVNATNLFNEEYYVCSSTYCSWGSGRTVMGSLKYQW